MAITRREHRFVQSQVFELRHRCYRSNAALSCVPQGDFVGACNGGHVCTKRFCMFSLRRGSERDSDALSILRTADRLVSNAQIIDPKSFHYIVNAHDGCKTEDDCGSHSNSWGTMDVGIHVQTGFNEVLARAIRAHSTIHRVWFLNCSFTVYRDAGYLPGNTVNDIYRMGSFYSVGTCKARELVPKLLAVCAKNFLIG